MTLPVLNVILWKVKSCCYGLISLRIGTTVIFGLTLIFSILQLFGWFPLSTNTKKVVPILGYYAVQYALLGIIVSICGFIGLYSVSNRGSSFLILPYIIITAVETVLLWIVMVPTVLILLSKRQSYDDEVSKYIGFGIPEEEVEATDAAVQSLIVWIGIGGLVLSVINWYCTSVVHSYYEELESEAQSDHGSAPRQDMVLNSVP